MPQQTTDTIVMIRPVSFESNTQTAGSNAFQKQVATGVDAQATALKEFDSLVDTLRDAGVNVHVFDDTPIPHTPDSIFPNNWFSTHADGTVVLYPMEAENRRYERRMDIIEALRDTDKRNISRLEDISGFEAQNHYLEGTGSLVLDRANRIAYACLSSRTDEKLLAEWGNDMEHEIVSFHANDAEGRAIYHTNVMMCIGDDFAVVCSESITESERAKVLDRLRDTGHTIVDISLAQMNAFAGNMLLLQNKHQEKLLVMSRRAHESLTKEQITTLEKSARIISHPINTIEDCAGGSVRCMIAEIFLPTNQN